MKNLGFIGFIIFIGYIFFHRKHWWKAWGIFIILSLVVQYEQNKKYEEMYGEDWRTTVEILNRDYSNE